VVGERTPHRIVVIDRDWVVDPHFPHRPADIVEVVLERELGCMHADYYQSPVGVLPGPGADVGELAQPVDAGVGPEVDQD
jgi:hypothetical protein